MNLITSNPFAHFALRAVQRVLLGMLIGTALWALAWPAGAQETAPDLPGAPIQRPTASLVLTSSSLRLVGPFGVEAFAIAEDGTVELSGDATIDFSPRMRAPGTGPLAGALRVRVGGRLYTLQLFEDVDCSGRGCPR